MTTRPTVTTMPAASVPDRADAIFDASERHQLERVLPAWITARRWYRTKTKRVQSATIVAAFPLPVENDFARIALVEVALDDGTRDTYVLPLAWAHGEEAAAIRARRPHAVVLPLRVVTADSRRKRPASGDEGALVDALALESFLRSFLAAVARGGSIEDGGYTLRFHPSPEVVRVVGSMPTPKAIDREQTNSSIVYGEALVAKVVRKLDVGQSPDLELGRVLTDARYPYTPAVAGWVDVRKGTDPSDLPSTVALLHGYVPHRGDAWEHTLESLDAWLGSVAHRDAAPPKLAGDLLTRAASPLPSAVVTAVGSYAALAELLGRRVGEMHVALASKVDDDVFKPEPLDAAQRETIATRAHHDLSRALTILGARSNDLPENARTVFAEVRAAQRSFERRLTDVARAAEGGVVTRVHGDLHLGQVLFTGSDFSIIDFEGEPARPLADRRRKRSPLVDVAGMLRSFHYASVAALRARPESTRAALSPWAVLWQRAATASFLRGWLEAVRGSVVLPSDPAVTRGLLDLFLLEKGIYELAYEMNNRPDWIVIPLVGLRELLEAEAEPASTTTRPALERSSPPPTTLRSGAQHAAAAAAAAASTALDARSPAVRAFLEGKATHAHFLLGAHARTAESTDFAVWAPGAASVSVIGDFDAWKGTRLEPITGTGIFSGRVAGALPGHRYKYRITTIDGATKDKADPFGALAEPLPGTASIIATHDEYAWSDASWMSERLERQRLDRPMSIYEVHLGSWRRVVEEGERHLGYREIAAPLADYVKEMGFTHVELMPLLEHPFYGSWGYGVTGFFSPTSRYGSPADLMFLVDTLHQKGIGVILDWVPAHFARDEHGLAMFDGGAAFEPADPARRVHPVWNSGLFDYGKPEVRSFLLSSAMSWIETFHVDGLRIDGVESILYRDPANKADENREGISFLRELTSTLKLEHPEVVLAAEDSSAWPGVTRAASAGGLGFDLTWDMGFSHDLRRYLGIDPIHRSAEQGRLTFRSVYAANEAFVLPLSHDEVVGDRGGALLEQMHGDAWQRLANLRLLLGFTYAQTGKKLLFMGNELAQSRAWHHDRSLDWHLAKEPAHQGISRLVRDLNTLYRDTRALHEGDASAGAGFEWIDGSNAAMSVLTFLRKGKSADDMVLVACNFTPVPRYEYRIGVPSSPRHWKEIFNTDAREYGGSGHGNLGGVDAVPYPWNGRDSSIVVTLPPLGILVLSR